jgi:hypothetical protein
MITKTSVAVFVFAASVFGPASTTGASSLRSDTGTQIAGLPRPAPVGHRQPRAADAPDPGQSSPADQELRRLDEEIDRRLIICRGC